MPKKLHKYKQCVNELDNLLLLPLCHGKFQENRKGKFFSADYLLFYVHAGIIAIGHNGAGSASEWDFKRLVITDNIKSLTHTLTCRSAFCVVFSSRHLKLTTPVDPVLDMSQWNTWTVCSPCPSGTRQRYRPCLAEYPQFGLTCITGQTPETITCVCDCLTPTDDGSSKDSRLTMPSGTTTFGAEAHYSCNNGKKWSTGTDVLVFRCSENEVWEPVSNTGEYAYDHGCINCGSSPTLGEAIYHTNDTTTTIDSEFVVNCTSGKQLPDGSTTVTIKCTWDEGTDSYKWVANTDSMKISVSSNFNWQIQIKGEGRYLSCMYIYFYLISDHYW